MIRIANLVTYLPTTTKRVNSRTQLETLNRVYRLGYSLQNHYNVSGRNRDYYLVAIRTRILG